MQKVFGILMVVGLVWAGIEYFTKGEAAFGGAFASGEVSAESARLPGERAAERLSAARDDRYERMERTISE